MPSIPHSLLLLLLNVLLLLLLAQLLLSSASNSAATEEADDDAAGGAGGGGPGGGAPSAIFQHRSLNNGPWCVGFLEFLDCLDPGGRRRSTGAVTLALFHPRIWLK